MFSNNGQAMSKSTLDSMFRYYSKKTGIKIHPHMLRHTHATELAREYISKREPINWEYISKRLGHSSVTTTMETYSHLKPEDYKKEYQRMQEYKESKRKEQ
jgi:integrase